MSEKAKFTAGPWVFMNGCDIFGPLGGDSGGGLKCDSSDGWQVAEVGYYGAFVGGELVELGEDVRKANAHLIAAAPELYEALAGLLEGMTDEDGLLEHVQPVIDARAALAKARGE